MEKISIPKYTLGEELVNAISHGIGALLSIVGLVFIILHSHSTVGLVSGIIYACFTILLYVISCVYHALSPRLNGKKILRVIDHNNVLLMVAGTYTPICLSLLQGKLGYIMFAFVWIVTLIAIILNSIDIDKYKNVCLACNLLLGWAAVFVIKPLYKACGMGGLALLVGGGVIYSLGAILYALGSKKKYFHSIFHFFVLAGSIVHYLFIYFYVI